MTEDDHFDAAMEEFWNRFRNDQPALFRYMARQQMENWLTSHDDRQFDDCGKLLDLARAEERVEVLPISPVIHPTEEPQQPRLKDWPGFIIGILYVVMFAACILFGPASAHNLSFTLFEMIIVASLFLISRLGVKSEKNVRLYYIEKGRRLERTEVKGPR